MAAEVFQQGDSPDVEEVGERCDRQESENQFVVFVLEDENPVSFEIEENADDGGDEVGDDVCVIELEQMLEDKEKQIIDEQAEGRIQHGHQHEPDKLRFKIPFQKCLYHVLTLRRQK